MEGEEIRVSKQLLALGVAFAVLAIIVGGCGGGDGNSETGGGSGSESTSESSSKSTSSLSKAEFVKKGNAICAKGEKEVEEGVEKFGKENNLSEKRPPSAKQVGQLVEKVLLPTVRRQLDEIRALGIPSGDEKEVEAIFAAVEEGIEKTEEDPSVFTEEGLGPSSGPFAKANKLSREYGLTVCGKEGE
jgi:hypothetical protein